MTRNNAVPVGIGIASAVALSLLALLRRSRRDDKKEPVDGMHIPLMAQENRMVTMGTLPITTITWFEGDHEKAGRILRERVEAILELNPWLGGRLVKLDGKVNILVPNIPADVCDENFRHCSAGKLPISFGSPFGHVIDTVQGNTMELILTVGGEYRQCLWKVSVIPCSKSPSTHFGVLVSMSHIIGDGHTFYSLHNMLVGDKPVGPLKATRIHTTTEQQETAMGTTEARMSSSWALIATAVRGVLISKVLSLVVGKRPTIRFLLVDTEKVQKMKEESKDETVPFVSTNDILTSWFLSNCACAQGFMAINFRGRLSGHTMMHAGNYTNLIYYRNPVDTAHPSLVRRSVMALKRVVTADRPYSNGELAINHFGLITNWASFHGDGVDLEGCKECFHLPIYEASMTPSTMSVCVVYRYATNKLAVIVCGTADKMSGLANAPFEAEEQILF